MRPQGGVEEVLQVEDQDPENQGCGADVAVGEIRRARRREKVARRMAEA